MVGRRALLLLLALLAVLGARTREARGALADIPLAQVSAATQRVLVDAQGVSDVWWGDFESGSFRDWTWFRRPEFDAREFTVVPAGAGAPALSGRRVARFAVSRGQFARGLQHAKLYREWAVRPPETAWRDDSGRPLARLPGSGTDASGTYSAWFYLPRRERWTSHWANILQFKLVAPAPRGGTGSEAHWWVNLTRASAWKQVPRRADGTRPTGGDPVLAVSNWTERRADGTRIRWRRRLVAPPVGRWFQLSVTVRQGRTIAFALDGRRWFTGTPADWPIGLTPTPTHPADDFSGWIFGVGLYGAPGRLFVDDAAFVPAR